MFVVTIHIPSSCLNCVRIREAKNSSESYVLDTRNITEARRLVEEILRQKSRDPAIQKFLCENSGYKKGEYFEVFLHKVPREQKTLKIDFNYCDSCGPEPYECLRM